jgi:hypothetical protein
MGIELFEAVAAGSLDMLTTRGHRDVPPRPQPYNSGKVTKVIVGSLESAVPATAYFEPSLFLAMVRG